MTCEDKFIQVTWAVVIEWRDKKRKKPGVLIQRKCSEVSTGWSPETSVNRALTWHAALPPFFFLPFVLKTKIMWNCYGCYSVFTFIPLPECCQIRRHDKLFKWFHFTRLHSGLFRLVTDAGFKLCSDFHVNKTSINTQSVSCYHFCGAVKKYWKVILKYYSEKSHPWKCYLSKSSECLDIIYTEGSKLDMDFGIWVHTYMCMDMQ